MLSNIHVWFAKHENVYASKVLIPKSKVPTTNHKIFETNSSFHEK